MKLPFKISKLNNFEHILHTYILTHCKTHFTRQVKYAIQKNCDQEQLRISPNLALLLSLLSLIRRQRFGFYMLFFTVRAACKILQLNILHLIKCSDRLTTQRTSSLFAISTPAHILQGQTTLEQLPQDKVLAYNSARAASLDTQQVRESMREQYKFEPCPFLGSSLEFKPGQH